MEADNQHENEEKIYMILDRHPRSEGNATGDNRNDATLGITEHGILQAQKQAEFMMNELFPRIGVENLSEVQIWASDYARVQQGLNTKMEHINKLYPGAVDLSQMIYSDDSLMERNFGKLPYAEHLIEDVFQDNPEIQQVIMADLETSKMVYEGTPHSAKPEMGESHKEIGSYTRHFRESMQRDIDEGQRIHWVMTHGDVIKQIVAKQLHQHDTPIPTPGNCDVILISGTPKDMTVQRVYDGEKMESCFDSARFFARPKRIGDLPFAQGLENG